MNTDAISSRASPSLAEKRSANPIDEMYSPLVSISVNSRVKYPTSSTGTHRNAYHKQERLSITKSKEVTTATMPHKNLPVDE